MHPDCSTSRIRSRDRTTRLGGVTRTVRPDGDNGHNSTALTNPYHFTHCSATSMSETRWNLTARPVRTPSDTKCDAARGSKSRTFTIARTVSCAIKLDCESENRNVISLYAKATTNGTNTNKKMFSKNARWGVTPTAVLKTSGHTTCINK